jgi:hypothetical protein
VIAPISFCELAQTFNCPGAAGAAVYSELHRHIPDVFNEFGVQIMTPAYEGDPEKPKVVPKEQMVQRAGERCG